MSEGPGEEFWWRAGLVSVPQSLAAFEVYEARIGKLVRPSMTVQTPSPIMTPFERGMGGQGIGQAQGNILSSRPFSSQSDRLAGQSTFLAHELVQGPLVRPQHQACAMAGDVRTAAQRACDQCVEVAELRR